MEEEIMPKIAKYWIWLIILIILFFLFKPFEVVDSGNRWLLFTWWWLNDVVLNEWLNWKMPIAQWITEVSIRPIENPFKVVVWEDGAITKDNQTIWSDGSFFYKYSENKLVEMWRNYGEDKLKSVTQSIIKESVKEIIGKYTIYELATNQEKIRNEIIVIVKNKIAVYPIDFVDFKINNYDWSEDFDQQIKTTMQRSQQVKQKEQELLITQQESQKKVKEAEANKEATIMNAEADKEKARLQAEAKQLEWEWIRKYNESVARNWDIELQKIKLEIEKIRAEKWNGVYVPNNMYWPIPVDTQWGVKGQ